MRAYVSGKVNCSCRISPQMPLQTLPLLFEAGVLPAAFVLKQPWMAQQGGGFPRCRVQSSANKRGCRARRYRRTVSSRQTCCQIPPIFAPAVYWQILFHLVVPAKRSIVPNIGQTRIRQPLQEQGLHFQPVVGTRIFARSCTVYNGSRNPSACLNAGGACRLRQILRLWCVRQAEGLGESADKVGVWHGVLFLFGQFCLVFIFSGSLAGRFYIRGAGYLKL